MVDKDLMENMEQWLEQIHQRSSGILLAEGASNTIIWGQNMVDRSKRGLREIAHQIEGAIIEAGTGRKFSPNTYKFERPNVFNGKRADDLCL